MAAGYEVDLEPWSSKLYRIVNSAYDLDLDGVADDDDNCPRLYNPGQEDSDIDMDGRGEGIGDKCRAIFPPVGEEDGRILRHVVNSTALSENALRIGNNRKGWWYKTIFSFDTDPPEPSPPPPDPDEMGIPIPEDMEIETAAVWVKRGRGANDNPFEWPGARVWVDIKQGFFGSSVLEWQDKDATPSQLKVGEAFDVPSGDFVKIEIDEGAHQYIDVTTGRVQLRLYVSPSSDGDNESDTAGFYSGNSPETMDKPFVLIRYGDPAFGPAPN